MKQKRKVAKTAAMRLVTEAISLKLNTNDGTGDVLRVPTDFVFERCQRGLATVRAVAGLSHTSMSRRFERVGDRDSQRRASSNSRLFESRSRA